MLPPPRFLKFSPPGVDPAGLRAPLIAIEGPAWAGVRTQSLMLQRHLERNGISAMLCEAQLDYSPGVASALKNLRDLAALQQTRILPLLRTGNPVILPRNLWSWLAHQGRAGEWARSASGFLLRPSATIYLRVPVPELVRRAIVRHGSFPGSYEDFCLIQQQLIKSFDSMAEPHGFRQVDGARHQDQVFRDVVKIASEVE